MIAQIIPLKRLPIKSTYYDYLIPTKLEKQINRGDLVEINFRNKNISGIVYQVKTKTKIKKMKNIVSIKSERLVTDWHFFLMSWFCSYYHISWSNYFYTFLPDKPKRKIKINQRLPDDLFTNSSNQILQTEPTLKIDTKKNINLVMPDNLNSKYIFYNQLLKKEKRLVYFFPTLQDLANYYNQLPVKFKNETIYISNKLNLTQQWQTWEKIASAKNYLVLTTRLGIFFPYQDNTCFVIDQSENMSYKQTDMNPRYNLITIMQKRSEYYPPTKALLFSLAPKIDHYAYTQAKHWGLVNQQNPINKLNIIDISTFKEHALLNIKLLEKISNDSCFIYLNRKGDFSYYLCNDCKWQANCPTCGQLLKLHQNKLLCHYCQYQSDIPLICPTCRGTNLLGIGAGTKNIKKLLLKNFSHRQIVQIDSDVNEKPDYQKQPLIIGTEYAFNRIDWSKIKTVVVLNGDLDLIVKDFRSSERNYQKYVNLIRSVKKSAKVIIQTKNPDNPIWTALNNYHEFWKSVLRNRQKYNYPPFVKLIKFIYANSDPKQVDNELNKTYELLLNSKTPIDIQIFPPRHMMPFKQFRRYYGFILIKHKQDNWQILTKQLDDNWLIDHDPDSI